MACPVMNDLYRHLAEEERREARLEAIKARADEIIESGDLDAIRDEMSREDNGRFVHAIAVFCMANDRISRDAAAIEIRHLVIGAAMRLAERQLDEEAAAAIEAAVVDRLYDRMEDIA